MKFVSITVIDFSIYSIIKH